MRREKYFNKPELHAGDIVKVHGHRVVVAAVEADNFKGVLEGGSTRFKMPLQFCQFIMGRGKAPEGPQKKMLDTERDFRNFLLRANRGVWK